LSHLYIKINILPRQARDEHRENSKKVPFSAGINANDGFGGGDEIGHNLVFSSVSVITGTHRALLI
jgi:hypothetical protein